MNHSAMAQHLTMNSLPFSGFIVAQVLESLGDLTESQNAKGPDRPLDGFPGFRALLLRKFHVHGCVPRRFS